MKAGTLLTIILLFFITSSAYAETISDYKKSFIKQDISGASQQTCIEVQYFQGGSYNSNESDKNDRYSIEVVHGISDSPQVFNLTINKETVLLDNDTYQIIDRKDKSLQAISRITGWARPLVILLIDFDHGTLLYTKHVNGGLIGTKTSSFIARCKADGS